MIESEEREKALDHMVSAPDGESFERCTRPICGSFLWARFLKMKFDVLCQEGIMCPVCTMRALNDAVAVERERCRRIANLYEKGPEEQAKIAGAIREQIEKGVSFGG